MAPRRHSGPHPGAEELSQTLVQLAGKVLERIKLQQARVELARALQRQIRLAELPEVPGLRTAACYVPARDNAAVVVISHDGNPGPASSAGGDDVAPFVRGGG